MEIRYGSVLENPLLQSGKPLVACFTGPRPKDLHGYRSREPYHPITNAFGGLIRDLAQLGVTCFISGGAQGFDQLAFWAVNQAKRAYPSIRSRVYVPFPSQPRLWSQAGPFSLSDYCLMLSAADEVRYVNPDPTDDTLASAARLLHARNHAMVADSDFVIALLSGRSLDWKNAKGGTAECVRHAASRNKPVLAVEYRPGVPGPSAAYWI